MIIDNYYKQRKKSLWISCSSLLFEDAKRDLLALTSRLVTEEKPTICQIPTSYARIEQSSGVMYCTYNTLCSFSDAKVGSNPDEFVFQKRVDQIIDWVGGESFDGIVS